MRRLLALVALLLGSSPLPAFGSATLTVVNLDGPGVGFNDPTPVLPVGGNPGTTLGEQRFMVAQRAADIWGELVDSDVPILLGQRFEAMACTATSGLLAISTLPASVRNFPNAPLPDTWYPVALASSLAGEDLSVSPEHFTLRFNVNVGSPTCFAAGFYLGFDNNHGSQADFMTLLLHEIAHGLGYVTYVNRTTAVELEDAPDVYETHLLDISTGLHFPEMTDAERLMSIQNAQRVVWDGPLVTSLVPTTLSPGVPLLTILEPSAIAGEKLVGVASFGAPLATTPISGEVVQALDSGGTSSLDGCEPIVTPLAGKIALIDRGICGFVVKVKNAQNAGAVAVLIADNVAGNPPLGMAGIDPTVVIPSVRITLPDGIAIKSQLASATVTASLGVDSTRLAGADAAGRMLVYTPAPVGNGSSLLHWDPVASPNQLMESSLNSDVTHDLDLALAVLRDMGWPLCHDDAECSDGDACNGSETCTGFECAPGAPPVCDDGNLCTAEACDATSGCLVSFVPSGTPCGGGGSCNGAGVCTGATCQSVQLSSATPGPLPSGGSAALTASGVSCGSGQTPEYKFMYRREGGPTTYTSFRPFGPSPNATFQNSGLPSGKYSLQVRARRVGSSEPYESVAAITLLSGNVCSSVSLGVDQPSPKIPGTTLNLTAAANCTEGAAQYKFLVRPPGTTVYTAIRGWGGPTFAWDTTGRPIGSYKILVYARGAGNTTTYESSATVAYTLSDTCTMSAVSASPPSPQLAGTAVSVLGEASCVAMSTPDLHYLYRRSGTSAWIELQPWGPSTSAPWPTLGLVPGTYQLRVDSRAPGLTGTQQGSKIINYVLK